MDSSSVRSDEDYDVVSNLGPGSLESSLTDFAHISRSLDVREIPPTDEARKTFNTVALLPTDIQAYVANTLGRSAAGDTAHTTEQTVRVYVDGVFDTLSAAPMLQLRQAKLSFAKVYLLVGVFSDDACSHGGAAPQHAHAERCEALRHCRWVDEVVPDAPWVPDHAFVLEKSIDYVALEEGSSVNPEFDKDRLKGYDGLKQDGRVIPTRKTIGLVPQPTTLTLRAGRSGENTPLRSPSQLELEGKTMWS